MDEPLDLQLLEDIEDRHRCLPARGGSSDIEALLNTVKRLRAVVTAVQSVLDEANQRGALIPPYKVTAALVGDVVTDPDYAYPVTDSG